MGKLYLYAAVLLCFLSVRFTASAYAESAGAESAYNPNCADIKINISVKKHYTSCKNPNGWLTATVTGLKASGNYELTWYPSSSVHQPGTAVGVGYEANNLVAGTYVLVVRDRKSGCYVTGSATVENRTPKIVQDVTILNDVIGCNGERHGRLQIRIIDEDGSQNVKTHWMEGPVVDFSKEIKKWQNILEAYQLPVGTFTVISQNNNTGCFSDPFTITIGQLAPPDMSADITANTSCRATGNGAITLNLFTPPPATAPVGGFIVYWYNGDDTNLDSKTPFATASGVTTSTVTNLTPGLYTVKVHNTGNGGSGCETIRTFEVPNATVFPNISLAATPNTICAPTASNSGYNGSITASVSENGTAITSYTNHTFNWYNEGGALIASNQTNTLTGLQDGNYQVQVVNNITGCTSGMASINVPLQTPVTGLNLTPTPQTNCLSGSPNGTITAQPTRDGTVLTSGYTLTWYQGNTISGPQITSNVSGNTVSGLAGGQNYTARVVDNTTGCEAIATVTVPLSPINPQVTATATPNTVCAPTTTYPYNGSITANVTENGSAVTDYTNYTFSWFDANGNLLTTSSSNTYSGLRDGTYQVRVRNNVSGCESANVSVVVPSQAPAMELTLSPTAQTNCLPGSPNGSITATVSRGGTTVTSGYTLTWYQGNTISGPQITSNISGNTVSGLAGGQNYTARVVDNVTGCEAITTVTVPLSPINPQVAATATPNTVCAPTTTYPYNGSITANVTENGSAVTDYTNYTFSWFDANGNLLTTSSSNTYSGLRDGTYQVRVRNNVSGCESANVSVVVPSQAPTMTLNLAATPQTYCTSTNGSITATVSRGGTTVTSGYTLTWYQGNTISGPQITSNISGNTVSGLAGSQNYTARVVDNVTGCEAITTVTVPLSRIYPEVTATPTPNTVCNPTTTYPYNGSIAVAIVENGSTVTNYSSYTFNWYDANGTLLTTGNTNTYSGLRDGTYQVRVINNVSGCESANIPVVVPSQAPTMALSLAATPQTYCTSSNGTITATVSRDGSTVTSGYTLTWFQGNTTSGPQITSNISGNTVSGLAGSQNYTARVVDNTTGCEAIATVTVPLNRIYPEISATATPNTVCASTTAYPYNGSITANVTENGVAITDFSNYTFSWFNATGTLLTTSSSNTYSGLREGTYQVRVSNNVSGCQSSNITVVVPAQPPVMAVSLTSTPQTQCTGTPNGTVTAQISRDGATVTSGYTLYWHQGATTLSPALPASNWSGNQAYNLAANQNITVRVVDNTTGCEAVATIFVQEALVYPTLSATVVNNTICDPALASNTTNYNGSITLAVNEGGSAASTTNYTYVWARSNGTGYTVISGQNGSTLSNIAEGSYRVQATNRTTGCPSAPLYVTVGADKVYPQVVANSTDQTACSEPYNGTASAQVMVGGAPAPVTNYTYEWFAGSTVAGTPITTNISPNGELISQLAEGFYTVRVTSKNSGCQSVATTYVETNTTTPRATITANAISCTAPGSLTANVTSPAGTYTYEWYRGRRVDPARLITSTNGSELTTLDGTTNLPSGYYAVVATNTETRCKSTVVSAYLAPPPIPFKVLFDVNRQPTFCNIDEGVVTAWVDNGTADRSSTGYTFEWYEGRPIDPSASFYSDPPIQFEGPALEVDPDNQANDPAFLSTMAPQEKNVDFFEEFSQYNGQTLFKRTPGIYSVVVTDNTTGCKVWVSIGVPFQDAHEALVIDITHADECNGVGSIAAQVQDKDGNVPVQSDYDFYLFAGSNPTSIDDAIEMKPGQNATPMTDARTRFEGYVPGVYTIVAVEKLSADKCQSVAIMAEIKQVAQPPLVEVTDMQPRNECSANNGQLTLQVGPAEYEPGQVDYFTTGFEVNVTYPDGTVAQPLGANVAAGSYVISSLPDGDYTFVVKGLKASGAYTLCETTETANVSLYTPTPVVSATITNQQTTCIPNGEITITNVSVNGVTAPLEDFDYTWYTSEADYTSGTNGTPLPANVYTISNLAEGTYYIVATKKANRGLSSGCASTPAVLNMMNVSTYPTIDFTATPNQACDFSADNGTLTAVATTATGGNVGSFEWFVGEDTSVPFTGTVVVVSPNEQRIEGLAEGTYTLRIVEGGCEVVQSYVVGSEKLQPVITANNAPRPNTSCDPAQYNGGFEISGVTYNGQPVPNSELAFTFYPSVADYENGTNGAPSGSVVNDLAPGTYVMVVEKTTNPGYGCGSSPFVVTIPDQPIYPVLSLTGVANNSCDDNQANGSITASLTEDGNAPTAGYSVSWTFVAADGTETGVDLTKVSADQLQVTGLVAGDYKAVATLANGCEMTATYTVGEPVSNFDMVRTATANTNCSEPYNGGFSISEVSYNGTAFTGTNITANFSLVYYTSEADYLASQNAVPMATTSVSGLAPGTYYVVVTKGQNPGAGCTSAPFVITVPDQPIYPVLSLTGVENNSCDPGQANGSITASLTEDGNAPTAGYSVSWTFVAADGTETAVDLAKVSADQLQVTGLVAGDYKAVATLANRCPMTATYTVGEPISNFAMQSTPIANTNCSEPYNGGFSISEVNYNGTAFTGADITSNFSFVYYRSEADYTAGTNGVAFTSTTVNNLAPGTYYVVVTKGQNPGAGCTSAPFVITVPDQPIYPVLSLTGVENNSCDPGQANGSITASLTEDGNAPTAGYSVSWTFVAADGTETAVDLAKVSADQLQVIGLVAGDYKAVATLANGCEMTATYTVGEPISNFAMQSTPIANTNCSEPYNGGFSISEVNYNGTAFTGAEITSNFSFVYYRSEADYTAETNGVAFTSTTVNNLAPGTYYVVVTKGQNPGAGCTSAPFVITVPDQPIYPVLSLTGVENNSCDPGQANGSITASLTEDGNAPTAGYSVSWTFVAADGTETAVDLAKVSADQLQVTGLVAGDYKAVATLANGCEMTATYTVGEPISNFAMQSTPIANTNCSEPYNGGFSISEVSYNGTAFTGADITSNFSFVYYRSEADYTAGTNGVAFTSTTVNNLAPGTYYVVVTKEQNPGAGCTSAPFVITVPDQPEYPVLNLTSTANNACDNSQSNGEITASIMANGAELTSGYIINWIFIAEDGTERPLLTAVPNAQVSVDGKQVTRLIPGEYRAEVIFTNGCPISSTTSVADSKLPIEMNVSANPQTTCVPKGGEAMVSNITVGGTAASLSDFTYNWYRLDDDGNMVSIFAGTTDHFLNRTNYPQIQAGKYYVEARKRNGVAAGCQTALYSIEIYDYSSAPTSVTTRVRHVSGCNPDSKGLIEVMVISPNDNDMEVTWYKYTQFDDTGVAFEEFKAMEVVPSGMTTSITNLDSAYYFVEIVDRVTGCSKIENYSIGKFTIAAVMGVSTENVSFCTPENGRLLVRVTNEEYYQLYPDSKFAVTITLPDGTTREETLDLANGPSFIIGDLGAGIYNISYVESGVNGCPVEPNTAEILDATVNPVPAVVQSVMLTRCDPALANAELVASVDGTTTGYTFEWFVGEVDVTTTQQPFLIGTHIATGLRDTIYTVRVTNDLTQCKGVISHDIEVNYPEVPIFSSWLTATPSTSCKVPNGSLRVSVDSLYDDYIFTWYRGSEPRPDSLISTGDFMLEGLSAGTYTITVTSLKNGCTSNAITKVVEENYYFPKYILKIKPGTCVELGSAELVDVEGKIPFYEWLDANGNVLAQNGPFSAPVGDYWLRITSDQECNKIVPVEITSVTAPYNAVSINGDGKNDYFHIDCLEMYLNNRVRIYNRAGTLVFETWFYDNVQNVFKGIGNRGVYFTGKELPVGTYYYIIDKNHKNEKPQTGFLELTR